MQNKCRVCYLRERNLNYWEELTTFSHGNKALYIVFEYTVKTVIKYKGN